MKIKHLFISILIGIFCFSVVNADTTFWILSPGGIKPLNQNYGISVSSSSTIAGITTANATSTNLVVPTSINLFGGGAKTTANALCIQLTGAADLCDGTDSGGVGGSGPAANWYQLNEALTPTTTIGIRVNSSSTFNGALSIASSSYTLNNTLFNVSTSTAPDGQLFSISGSELPVTFNGLTYSGPQTLYPNVESRVAIGQPSSTSTLDQFVLSGRYNTENWISLFCDNPVGATQIVADGVAGCDGFSFYEDGTGTLTASSSADTQPALPPFGALTATAANDGAGVFVNGVSGGAINAGSSTPIMEVTAGIRSWSTATNTRSYIGFSDIATAGTAYEVQPTNGCYFRSSTTTPNWVAVIRQANAETTQDTGVSSTTRFTRFRIEMNDLECRFMVKETLASSWRTVYVINNPTLNSAALDMNAGVWLGKLGTAAGVLNFYRLRVWYRDNQI